jgi:circadian clock protein KaiC
VEVSYVALGMRSAPRAPTGVEGLDHILGGGLPAARFHLIQGDPGSGKTTLGLQFLLEGLRRGEMGLYVTLSETCPDCRSSSSLRASST